MSLCDKYFWYWLKLLLKAHAIVHEYCSGNIFSRVCGIFSIDYVLPVTKKFDVISYLS